MMNRHLIEAKKAKKDEFYTLYEDIEQEIDAYITYNPNVFKDKVILLPCDDPELSDFTKYFIDNFDAFQLKKLISTCRAIDGNTNGKVFTQEQGRYGGNWVYLDGDGDFRSKEVTQLRDESDFIITNPPFSLFREFLAWVVESKKKFIVLGNLNAITYKNIFPLLKDNKMWLGRGGNISLRFRLPESYYAPKNMVIDGVKYATIPNVVWYTNVEHNERCEPIKLRTMEENIKSNKKLQGKAYQKYDNYDAIEVPSTDAIPSDYAGVMGVPVSFLSKYCSRQFKILGSNRGVNQDPNGVYGRSSYVNGKATYIRLFIKHNKTLDKREDL